MPVPIDPNETQNFINQGVTWLLGGLWALLTTLVGIVWKKHNAEIDEMKKKIESSCATSTPMTMFMQAESETKSEFTALRKSMEDADERKRIAIVDLHRKVEENAKDLRSRIDAIDDAADKRHNDLMHLLMSQKK